MTKISENSPFHRVAALCSRRECCVSDIRDRLAQWGAEADEQTAIIARLIEERYIDEARYARAFALDKFRYNHWGRLKIAQALRLQGISPADREAALREIPEEEYRAALRQAVQGKLPTIRARSDYERRGKLLRFLAGRGFEPSLAMEVLGDDD